MPKFSFKHKTYVLSCIFCRDNNQGYVIKVSSAKSQNQFLEPKEIYKDRESYYCLLD